MQSFEPNHHFQTNAVRNYRDQPNSHLIQRLKTGIWLYFALLIFEGALRKWFLPSLATPLLIVRDPLAIWLLFKAWQNGILIINRSIYSMSLTAILAFLTTMLVGHRNLYVAVFGLRIFLIHFPLMFVIGKVFNREDILKLGRIMLWITLPMIVLNALQFLSPQSAWVNRGVGGDMEGAGFSGALGYFRPPGTFSFTNGNSLFWGFSAPFIFYFWLFPKQIRRIVLLAATGALLISIPLSISRSLLFEVALTFLFALLILASKPRFLGRMLVALPGILLVMFLLIKSPFGQTGLEVFISRFISANETEGGLHGVFIDRFLGGMIGAITNTSDLPAFGYGIGMGSNVGSMLLSGERVFLVAEEEWGRLIGEMGIILGLSVILIRIALVVKISVSSFRKLKKGDVLPWLLLSFGVLIILQGQWAQPASLGFSTLIGGLIIASLKNSRKFKVRSTRQINRLA